MGNKKARETTDKTYYNHKDIMKATGKSYSSVKKWRMKIEELSGYEFDVTLERVSRHKKVFVYRFTEEEYQKFLKLSERIDKTKKLAESVVQIWGDQKAQEERQLRKDVSSLKLNQGKLIKAYERRDQIITGLEYRVKRLEERLNDLEQENQKGFFSRKKKR